jgi:hypothetical protein
MCTILLTGNMVVLSKDFFKTRLSRLTKNSLQTILLYGNLINRYGCSAAKGDRVHDYWLSHTFLSLSRNCHPVCNRRHMSDDALAFLQDALRQ